MLLVSMCVTRNLGCVHIESIHVAPYFSTEDQVIFSLLVGAHTYPWEIYVYLSILD